jgi:hypothetical protein
VSLRERIDRLEERERRLLGILVVVALLMVLMLFPLAVTAALHSQRSDNQEIREVLAEIARSRPVIQRERARRRAIEQRYARPAPPLAALLSKFAEASEIEIQETQDRQPIPQGKRYEEKATRITLRRSGMLAIVRFMERIERSGYPVSITQLGIRKRGVEPDSFDVDMVVSAFERKAEKVAVKKKTPAEAESAP